MVIFVTAASEQEGAEIGRTLVGEGLAACANIIPQVRSVYRWKGEIWDEAETLLIIKSREELFERIRSRIRELHSYEVPEIIAIGLDKGDVDYLKWIEEVTSKGD
ncbi:MAG: divalent-cation tolerance protein CutA [Deltaproteobacteria bacterium]|nr:MAG: divalent-cation tolerance protein CutA [Deltaproteobacteria bacterium]